MNGTLQHQEYWTLKPAAGVFETLLNSELSSYAKPIEAMHRECVSIDNQIAFLQERRKEAQEEGEKGIKAYDSAYYQLFLKKVRAEGKEYCACGSHVVRNTSVHLTWNRNCPGYYLKPICPECLRDIKAGRLVGCGNAVDLFEWKEEGGIRLFFKNGSWRPFHENTVDYTAADASGWIDPDLAKKYRLPPKFGIAQFD